jgi:predicted enzyme related to lactoylglutathione lyase
MIRGIRCIMVFAVDPVRSARWWADVLGAQVREHGDESDETTYAWFDVSGVEYGFHPADDDRNPRGGSPVIYWQVDNLRAARDHLLAEGCTPHRGPLRIDQHRQICQLIDPFGTVFGLDGP